MDRKPTYEELEQRVQELEEKAEKGTQVEETFDVVREQLFSVFNSIDEAIYVIDLETYEILYVNPAQQKAFQKELIGGICYRELHNLNSPCEFCTKEILLKQKTMPYRWEYHNAILEKTFAATDRIISWTDGRNVKFHLAIDITDRIKAEEETQKLASIVRHSSELVNLATLDGKMIFLNEAGSKMLGIDPDQVKKTHIMEVIPGHLRDKVQNELLPTIMEQHIWKGDLQYRNIKTGELTEVYAMTFTIQDKIAGKPLYLANVSLDITERNQAEEALRQYEHIVSSSTDMLALLDKHFRYIAANKAYMKAFELTPEQLIGNTVSEVFGEEFFISVIKPNAERCLGGEEVNYQDWFDFPAFEPRFMNITYYPYYNQKNKIVGFVVNGRNITDRKRAEEALKESEALYNALFTGITDAILVHSITDDGLPGSFIEVNDISCQMLGYTRDELIGMGIGDIDASESTVDVHHIVEELKAGRDVLFEQTHVAKDGRRIPVEVHAQVFDFNGHPAVLSTVRDITERKRTHEIMIQTEKMMTVGGLAAGMAHEINNPLAGIMQNIQVMKNRMTEKLPQNIKAAEECGTSIEIIENYMEKRGMFEMIDSVMDSGKRAAKIVDNMLSFSRKSDASFASHSLCDLLDKTVELAENDYDLKKNFDFRQIEIVEKYNETIPQVICEGSKIQQVFLNILKNGAQAMAESKDKEKTPLFILRVMQERGMVRVEIEDNGPGMDEGTRKRVFEPFYTTKSVGTGTGLGLSVSYFIITENHGGTMAVESSPGKGTKFIIRLPFERNVH